MTQHHAQRTADEAVVDAASAAVSRNPEPRCAWRWLALPAGCASAKTIVAINTDQEAPIFLSARFGVVGDYAQIVLAIIEELKKHQG